MKLTKVFDQTNFQEKGSFYKILNNLIEKSTNKDIEKILSNTNGQFKDIESENISKLFEIVKEDYLLFLEAEVAGSISQLDILIDILIRDGNAILKDNWFEELYKKQLKKLKDSSKEFIELLDSESKEVDDQRRRDYKIYRECVRIAYSNDESNNFDKKVTQDEYSILKTLSNQLELSNEEIRLIHYSVIPITIIEKDALIKLLKDLGIIIFSKKTSSVYVPDEIVKILRDLRGKSIADKYYRRLLGQYKDPIINLVSKKHNISSKLDRDQKIKQIISQGITINSLLTNDVYKDLITVNEKKKELNTLMVSLGIEPKGVTMEDKIQLIINHFNTLENDEKLGISSDGYNALCLDLKTILPDFNNVLINEFEFRDDSEILQSELLIDYNIKPRDILDLLTKDQLKVFCAAKEIKSRGDLIDNILDAYTDSENIYIENYVHLGVRDLNVLKINNIQLTAAEIGIKYEDVTKRLLSDLGFNIDESLRAKINTSKDKIDVLINLGNNEVIIVECKTAKSTQYNKFSACSRQMKAYHQNATHNGFRVIKSLLIAPDFTQDFIDECEMEIDLNLSLITSEVLYNIWNGFKSAKHQVFPVNLLMRDALISDEKILKALKVK
ncbi:MAG: hypothetical protein RJA76_2268 [Bacteroidota bacterium]|jgi:hypothetical protein